MTNNDIFKKLRVALQLRDDQIVEILELVDFRISKGEVGNFFRNAEHPKYVECGDQILRNFLNGLVIYLRGTKESPKDPMEVLKANKEQVENSKTFKTKKESEFKTSSTSPKKNFSAKKVQDKSKTFKARDNKNPLAGIKFNNGKKNKE
ncbi:DUF1456 family protein [Myroides sp. LJL119]